MKVKAVKTRLVRAGEIALTDLLAESIKTLPERSIVAISSKVVALCEGAYVDRAGHDKFELIKQEADYYADENHSPGYGYHYVMFKGHFLPAAGIDESNADGKFVLSPRDPLKTAEEIRRFLSAKFERQFIGVIITDSIFLPMKRGAVGLALGWSGFKPVKSAIGKKDLFGRQFRYETQSVLEGLAGSATLLMGEADERTPLAVISDLDFVEFTGRAPTKTEVKETFVPFEEDLYYPFLKLATWHKGGGKNTAKLNNPTT